MAADNKRLLIISYKLKVLSIVFNTKCSFSFYIEVGIKFAVVIVDHVSFRSELH